MDRGAPVVPASTSYVDVARRSSTAVPRLASLPDRCGTPTRPDRPTATHLQAGMPPIRASVLETYESLTESPTPSSPPLDLLPVSAGISKVGTVVVLRYGLLFV